jgi:hypothetical protein
VNEVNNIKFALVALAVGCSSAPVSVTAPESAGEATGTIAVIFTRPAKGVTIALDGRLVVERQHTDRVEIRGVDVGVSELQIAAGAGPSRVERHVRVEVDHNRITAVPVAAPDGGGGNGVINAVASILALVASSAITQWLF